MLILSVVKLRVPVLLYHRSRFHQGLKTDNTLDFRSNSNVRFNRLFEFRL
jgi:hypothetical protein